MKTKKENEQEREEENKLPGINSKSALADSLLVSCWGLLGCALRREKPLTEVHITVRDATSPSPACQRRQRRIPPCRRGFFVFHLRYLVSPAAFRVVLPKCIWQVRQTGHGGHRLPAAGVWVLLGLVRDAGSGAK